MDNLTKLALAGATVAAIVVGAAVYNNQRLESRLRDLQSMCGSVSAAEERIGFRPTCDVGSLIGAGESLKGVQADIVATQRAIWNSSSWPYMLALFIFVLACLPYAWYFLLRRIRELRSAIVGDDS